MAPDQFPEHLAVVFKDGGKSWVLPVGVVPVCHLVDLPKSTGVVDALCPSQWRRQSSRLLETDPALVWHHGLARRSNRPIIAQSTAIPLRANMSIPRAISPTVFRRQRCCLRISVQRPRSSRELSRWSCGVALTRGHSGEIPWRLLFEPTCSRLSFHPPPHRQHRVPSGQAARRRLRPKTNRSGQTGLRSAP